MSGITTENMYGAIVEEEDFFTSSNKKRAQEAIKKEKVDEIQLPDFPFEYDEKIAMETMWKMQCALQNILAKKRGSLPADNNEDNFKNAVRSGYFMMSTVTELWEFLDQFKKDNYEVTDLVKYEIIDAWHFVMDQLIYLKYKPTNTVQEFYDFAREDLKVGTIGTSSLHYLIGEFIEAVGELYQNTSYKDWRTYTVWKEDPLKIKELGDIVLIKFFKIFVNIHLTPDQVYHFYYNKNIENVKRQMENGRYEK